MDATQDSLAAYTGQDGYNQTIYTATEPGGIYWVDVTVNGCNYTVRDSILLSYYGISPVTLGNDTTLCVGEKHYC